MTEDDWSAAIDAELLKVAHGAVEARPGLEAAALIAADAADTGAARLVRRFSETLFGLAGECQRSGDEDACLQFEAQAIGALVQAAAKEDSIALYALRAAGGLLCQLANQALSQGGDTILASAMPAGRA